MMDARKLRLERLHQQDARIQAEMEAHDKIWLTQEEKCDLFRVKANSELQKRDEAQFLHEIISRFPRSDLVDLVRVHGQFLADFKLRAGFNNFFDKGETKNAFMERWVKGKVADGRQVIACATGITGGGKSVAMQEFATMINEAMDASTMIHVDLDHLENTRQLGEGAPNDCFITYSYDQALRALTEIMVDCNTCIMDEYIPPSGAGSGKLSDQLKVVIESCTRAARKNLLICTPEEHAIPQIDVFFEIIGKNHDTRETLAIMKIPGAAVIGPVVFHIRQLEEHMAWYRGHSKRLKHDIEIAGGASGAGGLPPARMTKLAKLFKEKFDSIKDPKYKAFVLETNDKGAYKHMDLLVGQINQIAVLFEKQQKAVIDYAFFHFDAPVELAPLGDVLAREKQSLLHSILDAGKAVVDANPYYKLLFNHLDGSVPSPEEITAAWDAMQTAGIVRPGTPTPRPKRVDPMRIYRRIRRGRIQNDHQRIISAIPAEVVFQAELAKVGDDNKLRAFLSVGKCVTRADIEHYLAGALTDEELATISAKRMASIREAMVRDAVEASIASSMSSLFKSPRELFLEQVAAAEAAAASTSTPSEGTQSAGTGCTVPPCSCPRPAIPEKNEFWKPNAQAIVEKRCPDKVKAAIYVEYVVLNGDRGAVASSHGLDITRVSQIKTELTDDVGQWIADEFEAVTRDRLEKWYKENPDPAWTFISATLGGPRKPDVRVEFVCKAHQARAYHFYNAKTYEPDELDDRPSFTVSLNEVNAEIEEGARKVAGFSRVLVRFNNQKTGETYPDKDTGWPDFKPATFPIRKSKKRGKKKD